MLGSLLFKHVLSANGLVLSDPTLQSMRPMLSSQFQGLCAMPRSTCTCASPRISSCSSWIWRQKVRLDFMALAWVWYTLLLHCIEKLDPQTDTVGFLDPDKTGLLWIFAVGVYIKNVHPPILESQGYQMSFQINGMRSNSQLNSRHMCDG
jgi:hypothetical protein